MNTLKSRLGGAMLAAACMLPLLAACTQMPTEHRQVADLRPQLSFKAANATHLPARVIVDNLDMGTVGDFRDGVAALKLLPGVHAVRVEWQGRRLLDESIYLGDGVNRAFVVQ